MQITDSTIYTYKQISLQHLLQTLDAFDGDCIVAYTMDSDGCCAEDVLVLTIDVYSDVDDEYLEFNGRRYVWEVELWILKSIHKVGMSEGWTIDHMIAEAKYYFRNRAFR